MSMKSGTAKSVTIVLASPSKKSSITTTSTVTNKSADKSSGTNINSVSTRITTKIEDEATDEQLRRLGQIFEEADGGDHGGLGIDAFRKAMRMTMGDDVTNEELDMVFMKVDTNCDGTVDWEEYLTFMLLECLERDTMTSLEPFPRRIRLIPSDHRESIVRLALIPYAITSHVAAVRKNVKGRYVACGRDGTVSIWSMGMQHKSTRKVLPASTMHTSVWVTDMACLPCFHMLVFATTARDLQFYDININRFDRLSRITGLQSCPTAITFHESEYSIPKLIWGDQEGGISAITLQASPAVTALNPKRGQKDRLLFSEILAEKFEFIEGYYMPGVHRDSVKQVVFSEHLNSVISISRIADTAMFIGDLDQRLTNSYFYVSRGLNTLDYSNKLNLIVTGGQDALVRVWNPYVTKKPISILRGHQSPVTQVHINDGLEQVVSLAENKEIRVHDINTHVCVQTFYRKAVPDLGFRSFSASIFNEYRQSLLFATARLMLIEHREEDLRNLQVISHTKPVTAAIYNPLFKQVVSAAADSTVTVWTMASGHKAMQFRVQTMWRMSEPEYIEVTAMCFDPTYRRLITATRLGAVSVWNFNNGACLHEYPVFDHSQITALVCARSRVIVGGWSRRVTIYFDNDDDARNVTWLKPDQVDDILDMAFYPPQTLATSSYEGRIYVWSLNTQSLLYSLETQRRPGAGGDMFDYKRRSSEVELADRQPRRAKNNRKLAQVAVLVDAATVAEPTTDITLPRLPSAAQRSPIYLTLPLKLPPAVPQSTTDITLPKIPSAAPLSRTDDTDPEPASELASEPAPDPVPVPDPNPAQRERTPSPSVPTSDSASATGLSTSCSVEKLLFLTTRENAARTASLLSACGDGTIRAWSVHHHGGYLGAWVGVHLLGDNVSAMNTCPDNTLLFTGDSSGYIRVWDISHYLVRGRGCSDEEHAERQALWDSFPMIPWLKWLEDVHMLHLDFHCMRKAHEWNTPHLLTSFRGHSTVINSIAHFENNLGSFLLTASVDCSVRLWTLNGRFMGIFGQSRLWELSHGDQFPPRRHRSDKYHRPRGFLLPPDIRKSGSCTTLHVMNGFTPNRWIRYVNLVRSVNILVSFLHHSSSMRLFREKQAQEVLDIPVLEETEHQRSVVENIAPKARIRVFGPKPKVPYYRMQCPAFHAFSMLEIDDIDFPQISEMLNDVSDRYSLRSRDQAPHTLKPPRPGRGTTKTSKCNSKTNGSSSGRRDGDEGGGRQELVVVRIP